MRQIVPNIYLMMGGWLGCNVYLLVSSQGLVLVDTGSSRQGDKVVAQMQEEGYALSELRTIVLTHAHADHIGSAVEMANRSGAQVLAHRDEAPYIGQTERLPTASRLQRLLRLGDPIRYRLPPCKVDRTLQDGDLIEALGGLQVIHTPGHTPGSICLYQPEGHILLCGDALLNQNPFTRRAGLRFAIEPVTVDRARARESVRKLLALPVEVLLFGHGEPLLENVGEQVRALIAEGS